MGSTRLPGKVAMDIGGKSMLERVVDRARTIDGVDSVVVATSTEPSDRRIEELADSIGIPCFRGSENDVLDRYYQTARIHDADAVVRITADCPLLDTKVSSLTVNRFIEKKPDYCSNVITRTFPRGLDTEVFSREVLDVCHREAVEVADREHVTRFIYRQPEKFELLSIEDSIDNSKHRWTVDTGEDLELVRRIYQSFEDGASWGLDDVLGLFRKNPDWIFINSDVEQKLA